MGSKKLTKIAVIIPCFNEEQGLKETDRVLKDVATKSLSKNHANLDLFYVDDGSTDKTWSVIKSLKSHGIKLSRNFGHQNALLAGLSTVTHDYDAVISIDSDLQDDPYVIPEMIKDFINGTEVVYGVRSDRPTDSWFKKRSAEIFYHLMNMMGVEIIPNHADFRLLSQRACKQLVSMPEHDPFLRGLVPKIGFKSGKVFYVRKERQYGQSKYPLTKMIKFAWDGITSTTIVPLRLLGFFGFLGVIASIITFLYALIGKLLGHTELGWASIISSIYLVGGMNLVSLSVLGEYVGKIFTETKHRPRFIIEEEIV